MKPIQYKNRVDYKKQIERLENQRQKVRKLEKDLAEAQERLEKFPECRVIKVKKEVGDLTAKEAEAKLTGRQQVEESVRELAEELDLQKDTLKAVELKTDSTIRKIKQDCRTANEKTMALKAKELFGYMDQVRDTLGQMQAFRRKCEGIEVTLFGQGATVSGPSNSEYIFWRDRELKRVKTALEKDFCILELEDDTETDTDA